MGENITLEVQGNRMRAYYAAPEGAGPFPGIVVTHHREGLDKFTEWVVDDLAANGFAAIAPDHYHRQPDGLDFGERKDLLRDSELAADLAVSRSYLECQDNVDGDRLGILGHCMGGRTTYLGAAVDARYKTACAWYSGGMFVSHGNEGPSPYDRIPDIAGKVMGFYGNNDKRPSPDDVNKIEAKLAEAGIPHEIHRYDDTGHAFMDFTAQKYIEPSAKDSWARALAFMKAELAPARAAE